MTATRDCGTAIARIDIGEEIKCDEALLVRSQSVVKVRAVDVPASGARKPREQNRPPPEVLMDIRAVSASKLVDGITNSRVHDFVKRGTGEGFLDVDDLLIPFGRLVF